MGEKLWNGEGVPALGEFCEFKGSDGWRKVQIAYRGPELISATYHHETLGTQEMAFFYRKEHALELIRPIKREQPEPVEEYSLQHWKDLAIQRFHENNHLDTENIALRSGLRRFQSELTQFMKENKVAISDAP